MKTSAPTSCSSPSAAPAATCQRQPPVRGRREERCLRRNAAPQHRCRRRRLGLLQRPKLCCKAISKGGEVPALESCSLLLLWPPTAAAAVVAAASTPRAHLARAAAAVVSCARPAPPEPAHGVREPRSSCGKPQRGGGALQPAIGLRQGGAATRLGSCSMPERVRHFCCWVEGSQVIPTAATRQHGAVPDPQMHASQTLLPRGQRTTPRCQSEHCPLARLPPGWHSVLSAPSAASSSRCSAATPLPPCLSNAAPSWAASRDVRSIVAAIS